MINAMIRPMKWVIALCLVFAVLPAAAAQSKTFVGDGTNECILGTPQVDTLNGAGGGDFIHGYAAADELGGGLGRDAVYGGENGDTIYGGDGSDSAYFGLICGTEGAGLWGGPGNDVIYGNEGADYLEGGDGVDQHYGNDGNDVIYAVDDTLTNDIINGGPGYDTCHINFYYDTEAGCEHVITYP